MKGIIVVDVPKNCEECGRYYTGTISGFGCRLNDEFISTNIDDKFKKPDWCPIKPMPLREEPDPEYCEDEWSNGYNIGWNICIDYILNGGK